RCSGPTSCTPASPPCARRPSPTAEARAALREVRVLVPVRRGAAAEEAQRVGSGRADLVPRTGRDRDGISGLDLGRLAVDLHHPGPVEDEVDLLAVAVVVALGLPAG